MNKLMNYYYMNKLIYYSCSYTVKFAIISMRTIQMNYKIFYICCC